MLASDWWGRTIEFRFVCRQRGPEHFRRQANIEQVLLNLVVNARDAMPQGGTLCLSVEKPGRSRPRAASHPEAGPGGFVVLTAQDTGCGMDEETQNRLFEPFFTTKPVGQGTGLGLATVYGIVKQHEGWIEVQSEVGVGSVFRVYLPALGEMPKPKSMAPKATAPAARRECIRGLEDEPQVCQKAG